MAWSLPLKSGDLSSKISMLFSELTLERTLLSPVLLQVCPLLGAESSGQASVATGCLHPSPSVSPMWTSVLYCTILYCMLLIAGKIRHCEIRKLKYCTLFVDVLYSFGSLHFTTHNNKNFTASIMSNVHLWI